MKRADLEHILRASKGITCEDEFIVLGSQSILGPHPDAPKELRMSMEADLYPKNRPDLSPLIEGALGELSAFHSTFGYYADGVSPGTATLPADWEKRLIPLRTENTGGATGWCLEPHDLAFSKLAARRGRRRRSCRRFFDTSWFDHPGWITSSPRSRIQTCATVSPRR